MSPLPGWTTLPVLPKRVLARAGARVVSLQPDEVSLERAFLELTGAGTQS